MVWKFHLAQQVAKKFNIDLRRLQYDTSIVTNNIENVLFHTDQPHGDFLFFDKVTLPRAHDEGVIVAFNSDGQMKLWWISHNADFFSKQTRTNFALADYFSQICFMPEIIRTSLTMNSKMKWKILLNYLKKYSPWRHLEPIDQVAAYETTTLAPGNNLIKTDRMGLKFNRRALTLFRPPGK